MFERHIKQIQLTVTVTVQSHTSTESLQSLSSIRLDSHFINTRTSTNHPIMTSVPVNNRESEAALQLAYQVAGM